MNAEGIPCHGGYSPLYHEVLFQRVSAGQGAWCQAAPRTDYAAFAEQCPVFSFEDD